MVPGYAKLYISSLGEPLVKKGEKVIFLDLAIKLIKGENYF